MNLRPLATAASAAWASRQIQFLTGHLLELFALGIGKNRQPLLVLLFTQFAHLGGNGSPVAAVSGVPPGIFAVYSVTGAAIWAAVWLALGTLFSSSLLPVVEEVFTWAPRAVGVLAAVGLLLLAVKAASGWWAVRTDRRDKRRQAKSLVKAPRQPSTEYLVELENQA